MPESSSIVRDRRAGKGLFGVVIAVALLAVVGFAAYKFLFDRPGEAAAAFVPSDADVVITLDTNPSERQAATFQKITDALQREGIAEKFDDALKGILDGSPVGAEVRPHLKRSFAMAYWIPSQQGQDRALVLLAIDDPGAVGGSLSKHGKQRSGGVYEIPSPAKDVYASVVENYLAIGNSPEAIEKVEAVRSGGKSSVTKLSQFQEARSSLPSDANLMVFLSPRAIEKMNEMTQGMGGGGNMWAGTDWLAFSTTVEPEGIAFDYHCPMNADKVPVLKPIASARPFDYERLKMLPDGAYGLFGYSQAAKYWDCIDDALSSEPEAKKEFDSGIEEFERETGLSVTKDVLPAFQGEQVFAVYPGPSGDPADVDGIVMITDSNGADPAALAGKVRGVVERMSAQSGKGVRFVESKIGEVTVWEIDPESRKGFTEGLAGGMSGPAIRPVPEGAPPGLPQEPPPITGVPGEATPPPASIEATPPPAQPETGKSPWDSKTIVFAQFGKSVVVCSSRGLLNRTIAASQGGKTLRDDPAYAGMRSHIVSGSQAIGLVDLRRIMDAVKPMVEEGTKGGPVLPDDVLNMFGKGAAGLVISGSYDGKIARGRMMIPIDFERVIGMMGTAMRSSDQ